MRYQLFIFLIVPFLLLQNAWSQKPNLIIPQGHNSYLIQIQFSPDGDLIYTSSIDGATKIWEANTGHLLHTINGNPSFIVPFALAPNSNRLAIGGETFMAQIWDLANGEKVQELPGSSFMSDQFVFSPDGNIFLSAHSEGIIEARNIETSLLTALKKRHTEDVESIAFSNDGAYILSLGMEDSLKVWNAKNWQLVAQIGGLQINEQPVHFLGNSSQITFGQRTGEIQVWDFLKNKLTKLGKQTGATNTLSSSEDSRYILSSDDDFTIYLWDLTEQRIVFTKQVPNLISAQISKDGKLIISGHEDGKIMLWDASTGDVLWTKQSHQKAVNLLQFSPDGKKVVSSNSDEEEGNIAAAMVWDVSSGQLLHQLDGKIKTNKSLYLSPDKRYLITGQTDGQVRIWDNLSSQLIRSFQAHERAVTSIHRSPDGQQLLTAGDDQRVKVWRFPDMVLLRTLEGPQKWINMARFSPDGQKIIAGGGDLSAFVWNISNDQATLLNRHQGEINSIDFSSDSRLVITASADGTAKIWDFQSNTLLRTLAHSGSPLYAAVFSEEGTQALTASGDGSTKVWNLKTGQNTRSIETPMDFITKAVFSADHRYLFQGNEDAICQIWDLESGHLKHTLTSHNKELVAATFSADETILISSAYDNTCKFWDLQDGKELGSLVSLSTKDWALSNLEGLFDATTGAMSTMHYVVNDQRKWEAIDIQQLKTRYYEPGLLSKIMGLSEESIRPVAAFEEIALYPEVLAYTIENEQLQIKLQSRSGGLGKLPVFINGKEISSDANPLPRGENSQRSTNVQLDLKNYQKYLLKHPDSSNYVQFSVYNEGNWLKSSTYQIKYQPKQARGDNSNSNTTWKGQYDPKLYVVSIGTSNYKGRKLDLQYADQDATMIARSMGIVGKSLFANGDSLEIYCLTTASADSTGLEGTNIPWNFSTKNNIQNTLRRIQSKAKAEDILMVYFSGHGVTYGGSEQSQFHYLTQGIGSEDLSDEAVRRAYTISSDELTDWINAVPALKQVLIIDACNSGQIVSNLTNSTKALSSSQIRALDRMQDRTGMFVLSGSAADKVSYEASAYGQGLLTYALLQGMRGLGTRKDIEGESVDVMQLFQYARDEVPRLAALIQGIQTPMLGFPNRGASFDLGILDENTKALLPFASAKPIIIQSTFLNQTTFRDDIQLAKKLNVAFRKESEKGQKANLIFVDVEDYPNAYSLGGFYTIDDEVIDLKIKLFQGEKGIDLSIKATDDPDKLVKYILRAVYRAL